MKKNRFTATAVVFAISLISGCSTVSQTEVLTRVSTAEVSQQEFAATELARQRVQSGLVVQVGSPYLSSRSVTLARDAHVPEAFRKASSFVRPPTGRAGFTISEVADLITKQYNIRTRIRPDVFLLASTLVPGSGAGTSTQSGSLGASGGSSASSMPQPIPSSSNGSNGSLFNPGMGQMGQTQTNTGQYGTVIDFDFVGSLSDYLQRVSAVMGITAEWDDANQELLFYRLQTRTYTLDTTPMKSSTQSVVSKGTSASTGGAGGGGSIAGSVQAQSAMDLDTWEAVEKALNTFKTKSGAVVLNRGTRTITVVDTRDVIEIADKYMAQQNEVLGRQVVLSVRLISVTLSREAQAGFSIEAAFTRFMAGTLNADWTAKFTGAGSLGKSTSSSATYAIVNPGRSTTGSQVVAQFLNQLGNVVDEFSQDVPVRNNRTVPIVDFASFGYLSKTTPAAGGATGGAGGVPGLTTDTVTSGTFLMLTPTIKSNESLVLALGLDRSADPVFDTIGTGSGATFQQVQLVRQRGIKIDTEVGLRNGETLLLMGQTKDSISGDSRIGLTGGSRSGIGTRQVQFLMVTPRIVSGS